MILEWKQIHTKRLDKNWDFCLLERTHGWLQETTYRLTAHHLDIQVTEGLNNSNSVLANIIPNNNEKPIKIDHYRPSTWGWGEPKETSQNILTGFRGSIIGYPHMRFSVHFNTGFAESNNNSTIYCDVIEIDGGQICPNPAYGALSFRINFYKFSANGEVELIKQITDTKCQFTIHGQEFNGQILSKQFVGPCILCPREILDFIQKCKTGYMGRPPYKWEEVLGNKTDDSTFSTLLFDIRGQYIFFYYHDILHQRIYKIFRKDEEWLYSTDRYLWAIYRFQSSYHLVKIINQIIQIAEIVQQDKENHIGTIEYIQMFKFKKTISKSEFESATGIHLFESIITTDR